MWATATNHDRRPRCGRRSRRGTATEGTDAHRAVEFRKEIRAQPRLTGLVPRGGLAGLRIGIAMEVDAHLARTQAGHDSGSNLLPRTQFCRPVVDFNAATFDLLKPPGIGILIRVAIEAGDDLAGHARPFIGRQTQSLFENGGRHVRRLARPVRGLRSTNRHTPGASPSGWIAVGSSAGTIGGPGDRRAGVRAPAT